MGRERDTESASVSDRQSTVSTRFAEDCKVVLPITLDQALNPRSVPLLPGYTGDDDPHAGVPHGRSGAVHRAGRGLAFAAPPPKHLPFFIDPGQLPGTV